MKLFKIVDGTHPFYRPMWRRVAITLFCAVWAVIELSKASFGWAVAFGVLTAMCIYEFFVIFGQDDDSAP